MSLSFYKYINPDPTLQVYWIDLDQIFIIYHISLIRIRYCGGAPVPAGRRGLEESDPYRKSSKKGSRLAEKIYI